MAKTIRMLLAFCFVLFALGQSACSEDSGKHHEKKAEADSASGKKDGGEHHAEKAEADSTSGKKEDGDKNH